MSPIWWCAMSYFDRFPRAKSPSTPSRDELILKGIHDNLVNILATLSKSTNQSATGTKVTAMKAPLSAIGGEEEIVWDNFGRQFSRAKLMDPAEVKFSGGLTSWEHCGMIRKSETKSFKAPTRTLVI
jgi:hypothetical protein